MTSSLWKKIGFAILIIFAFIGFGLTAGYFAVKFGWTNTTGIIDTQRQAFLSGQSGSQSASAIESGQVPDWQNTPQWQTLEAAILKDQGTIDRAAATAGVPPRLIVENLIAEQLRFFFDDRASYEQFFAPLKILGSETQFSWGVMGVKETTAVAIESHLTDSSSPFYIGPEYSHLLDFDAASSTPVSQQRFIRLTDQHDHYYSYLYAGLYIRQVETQWKRAGIDISKQPDIIATLYNVGFENSHPHTNPQSGGAAFSVNGVTWSFGSLAQSFYNSPALTNEFPQQ